MKYGCKMLDSCINCTRQIQKNLGHHMDWMLFKSVHYTWEVVKWFPEKSKSKNTKKFTRVRRMWGLPIPHFFGLFKIFWDIIWLGCCLNYFVTLGRWSNDIRKNTNPKILKISEDYKECEEFSHSSYPPNSPLLWTF